MNQQFGNETSNNELQKHFAEMQTRQATAKSDSILSLLLTVSVMLILVITLVRCL